VTDSRQAVPAATEARASVRSVAARLVVGASSIVIGLLALEAATRVVFDRIGMHYGIEMWKYAKEIKQRSPIAAMSHEHAPNREATLMGVRVRTSSVGLRDREFPRTKTPGVRRIMVLGDSITFGWGTAVEDTYPKVLERLLQEHGGRYEVINTGVGNYNSAQQVAYFRERGMEFQPDDVILGFYINDAEPTPTPVQNILARHSYFYVLASSGFDSVQRRMGWKTSFSAYYNDLYEERNPGWRACRDAIAEFGRLARSIGANHLIVLIPELHSANANYPFRRVHDVVAEAAQRERIPVLDLTPAFAGIPPSSLWVSPGDAHPNARGHAIIGRAIYEAMVHQTGSVQTATDDKGTDNE
jgi:lysophospholipase L1-like esterase